jgi:hypothetical protein
MPRRIIQNLLFNSGRFIGDRLSVRAKACYSLRRLYSDWFGFAIRVRKTVAAVDSFLDIGFTANGDLHIAALLDFADGGNVFIQTKYDQSGNGYHEINNTNASQPQIVVSGAVNLEGLRPALLFSGSQFLSTSNWSTSNMFGGVAGTINVVAKSTALSDQDIMSWGGSAVLTLRSIGGLSLSWRSTTGGDAANGTVTSQTFATVTGVYGNSVNTLYTQGISRNSIGGTENTNVTELFIGQRSSVSTRFLGNFSEGWIFPDALSTSDLSILHRDQGDYYKIVVS